MNAKKLRVLIVHNHYGDFAVGGEAGVMRAEAQLLVSHGHEVSIYERTNAELERLSRGEQFQLLWNMPWSGKSYRDVADALDRFKPDIMHVHNYWLMLGPSIFAAAKERGLTTVLTLHNYRLLCPGGQLLSGGRVCEDCSDGRVLRALWRRCYPGKSLLKSFLSLRLYQHTRFRQYLAPWVDAYIALSAFARRKFQNGGLPPDKIHVKPNFIEDPMPPGDPPTSGGHGAVFVGRLSEEKGLSSLLEAWKSVPAPLTIVGDGPEMTRIARQAPSHVSFTGKQSSEAVFDLIRKASFLVLPSLCYEGFPMTVIEAMAMGRAVLASDLGPRREVVQDEVTGLLFRAGDIEDLRRQALRLIENPDFRSRLGMQGRKVYLERYTSGRNYQALIGIYQHARNGRS
ncbi:MAG: glycosyltransferase family 4 protein [Syntrophobacteraceae bacterium]